MCTKEIFEKINKDKNFKKKNNLADNFMNIAIDDMKYSNNAILKNLILENKIFFCFIDHKGIIYRLDFSQTNINSINASYSLEGIKAPYFNNAKR